MQLLPALVQPVQVYDVGRTVQRTLSVTGVPTAGVVLLALTVQLGGCAGVSATSGRQSTAIAVASLTPMGALATTP